MRGNARKTLLHPSGHLPKDSAENLVREVAGLVYGVARGNDADIHLPLSR